MRNDEERGKARNEKIIAQILKDLVRIAGENDLVQFRKVSRIINDRCTILELPKKSLENALRIEIGLDLEFHIEILILSEKALLISSILSALKNALDPPSDEYGLFYPI